MLTIFFGKIEIKSINKYIPDKFNTKNSRLVMLRSHEVESKVKQGNQDKWGHFVMTKGTYAWDQG
jgi:hypothetical protein